MCIRIFFHANSPIFSLTLQRALFMLFSEKMDVETHIFVQSSAGHPLRFLSIIHSHVFHVIFHSLTKKVTILNIYT